MYEITAYNLENMYKVAIGKLLGPFRNNFGKTRPKLRRKDPTCFPVTLL